MKSTRFSTIIAFIILAISILFWGVTFVSTRALLKDFSSLEILVLRFFVAYVALWALYPKRVKLARGERFLFALLGLSGVAIYQLLENCAIFYTNASNVAILVSICPMVTALMARLFFGSKEKFGLNFVIGFILAILGVAMVSLNGINEFHFNPIGDMMAITAMISWGVYSNLVDRINKRGYSHLFVIRNTFKWALLFTIPLLIFGATDLGKSVLHGSFTLTYGMHENIERFSNFMNHVNLGFLGIFASAMCFVFWNMCTSALGVVRCSIGLYLVPIVTVLFAYLFLGEELTLMSGTGFALTLLGVVLSGWKATRDTK